HLERLPDLLPGRVPVDVMHLVEVDVVGLQPSQAALAGAPDVERGESLVVRSTAEPPVHLGGEDDLVAPPAALRQPASDDLLGDALARLPPVDVRGIEEVDAGLERPVHHGEAVGLAGVRAEVHRSQTEPADAGSGPTELDILHRAPLLARLPRQTS